MALLLGFFMLSSCGNEEEQVNSIQQKNSWNDISESSTEGIDFVRNKLIEKINNNARLLQGKEAQKEAIISSIDEYLESENFSEESRQDVAALSK